MEVTINGRCTRATVSIRELSRVLWASFNLDQKFVDKTIDVRIIWTVDEVLSCYFHACSEIDNSVKYFDIQL